MKRTIALCCLTALAVAGLVPAYGAVSKLITGKQIKNHSITGADIKKGSLPFSALSRSTQKKINTRGIGTGTTPASQGENGTQGVQGPAGPTGQQGAPGKDANIRVTSLASADNGASPGDWFGRKSSCDTSGPVGDVAFGSAPGGPAGSAAAIFTLPNGDGGNAFAELRTRQFDGLKVKDITELGYTSRYQGGGGTGADPYLFVNTSEGLFSFAPANQAQTPTADRWQSWDVLHGKTALDDPGGGVPSTTFEDLASAHPNATIVPTSAGGGFRILDGCAGAGSENSTGAVDNVRVEIAGQRRVFDFELPSI